MYKSIEETEIHSRSLFLVLFSGKGTIKKLYPLMQFTTSIGKDTHNVWILRTRITIEETIQLLAVSVKVNYEPYLSLFANLLNKCLD